MRKGLIKNFIFDWSGTLSDDFTCTYEANMGVFRKLGLRVMPREDFRREFALPYMEFYRRYTETPRAEIDRIFEEEFKKAGPQRLYPGAKGVLHRLRASGATLMILSTCARQKIMQELERFDIRELFADVWGGVYDKAEGIPRVLSRHGLHAEETAYVGDMTHDIDAGNKAEVTSVAITRGYQPREKLAARGPKLIIDDLDELLAFVKEGD